MTRSCAQHVAGGASIASALLALALAAGCVFPGANLGSACTSSATCFTNVCVLLDETDAESGAVCMPMLKLAAPQACVADEDCALAGWPIDARCSSEGRCTCEGDDFDPSQCSVSGEVIGEHTCRCLPGKLPDDAFCQDDNQCVSTSCGDGFCGDGTDGAVCDSDEDCPLSVDSVCEAGTCI